MVLLALLSLCLLGAVVASYPASYQTGYGLRHESAHLVSAAPVSRPDANGNLIPYNQPPLPRWSMCLAHGTLDVELIRAARPTEPTWAESESSVLRIRIVETYLFGHRGIRVTVPPEYLMALIVLLAAYPATKLARFAWRRRPHYTTHTSFRLSPPQWPNTCRKCDYDLTGNTSGRCPECGTRVKKRNAHAEPRQ